MWSAGGKEGGAYPVEDGGVGVAPEPQTSYAQIEWKTGLAQGGEGVGASPPPGGAALGPGSYIY